MLNPVFRREIVTTLRTWRTFTTITAYVIGFAGVAASALYIAASRSAYYGFNPQDSVNIYIMLMLFQLMLIIIMIPGFAAFAISGEKERQTFDLMIITKMSTLSIVLGKLMASLLVVVLMIAASVPVFGVVMHFNAASLLDLLVTTAFSIFTAAMVGSIAICMSSLFKKSAIALIMTYVIVIIGFMLGLTLILSGNMLFQRNFGFKIFSDGFVQFMMACNPILGIMSIFDAQMGYSLVRGIYNEATMFDQSGQYGMVFDVVPLWVFNVIFDVVIVLVLCLISSVLIKPVKGRMRS